MHIRDECKHNRERVCVCACAPFFKQMLLCLLLFFDSTQTYQVKHDDDILARGENDCRNERKGAQGECKSLTEMGGPQFNT